MYAVSPEVHIRIALVEIAQRNVGRDCDCSFTAVTLEPVFWLLIVGSQFC